MSKFDNAYLLDKLISQFGTDVSPLRDEYDLLTVHVNVDAIIDVLTFLKYDEELQFIHLTDINDVHYPLQKKAFEIVYHVNSLINNIRIRVKV